ncbi:hypothetical protein BG011_003733 [Mortierella polycephala]|uniref:Uncharacterized protein n=1 Tax=Mortierella polycephala TaxID=41804 RepID=A0A9P6Q087_9FUNG|nr:hypothetical protein BG011_003733 [Mortierella polycephala]
MSEQRTAVASTVQEAVLVLQAVLDTLHLRDTPPTIAGTQGVTSTRCRDGIVLTSTTLCNAFQIINYEDTRQILSQFFRRLFGQVYESLISAPGVELASRLELVSDIICAVHQASAIDKYNADQSRQANIPVLHALIVNLLEPTWILLDRIRVRGNAKHTEDQTPSFHSLLRVEEVMATILIAFCKVTELQRHWRPHMLRVVSLVASLYDECILPMHLSSRCTLDPSHLFSGILALFQLFKELHSFESIQRAYKQLVARLCASDAVERALHTMQAASAVVHVASCKGLIVTILESIGVFCDPAQDVAFTRPGDLLPRLDALATLNYNELPSLMVPGDGLNSNLLHLHHENQRWAIAFLYMQLAFARYPAVARGLTESISSMVIKETTLGHLYGASWIQLVWIYIKLDYGDDKSRFQTKPFTYSKFTNGLRISIRDSEGGFARRLLTRHLEEILIWLWKHECLHSDETLRMSNNLILEMMMIWIMGHSPPVLSHRPTLKNGTKIEHISKTILMFPCAIESIKVVHIVDDFITSDCHIPRLQWVHAAPDVSPVSQVLLQIEIIHTDDRLNSRLPILEKMTTTVRLLMVYAEFDKSRLG